MIHNVEQGTAEWHSLRIGRITGTRIADMAGGTKATVETLCFKVATEILTGQASESTPVTAAMQHGTMLEPEARSAFSVEYMLPVAEVGFFEVDELFGVSPDGLIGDYAGLEIKCPMPHTHLRYLIDGDTAWRAYRWQVQGSLWATKRDCWYFASYCPAWQGMGMALHVNEVKPDPADQHKIAEAAEYCRKRISEIIKQIRG